MMECPNGFPLAETEASMKFTIKINGDFGGATVGRHSLESVSGVAAGMKGEKKLFSQTASPTAGRMVINYAFRSAQDLSTWWACHDVRSSR